METHRWVLGGNPSFVMKKIPEQCVKEKTITLNALGILTMFRDRTPMAVEWIEEMFPTMWIGPREQLISVFWNTPENTWFEFDTGRKTLFLCSLEKNPPK